MADKLGLGSEVKELKIGQSFTNPKSTAFHTIKYDFKPASVDVNKIANVTVGNNNQVTVTVPHLDGAGTQHTVFKGSQRPLNKECVLIIDKITGEITLEKLSANIQLKKTRSESVKPLIHHDKGSSSLNAPRAQTPPNVGQRTSSKTKVTSGSRRADRQITHLVPKHSPLHASPNYPSPGHHKSPKREREVHSNLDNHSHSTLASLPMIGMDDPPPPILPSIPNSQINHSSNGGGHVVLDKSPLFMSDVENGVEEMSDSSSSSSSSDSDSDNDRTIVGKGVNSTNGHANGMTSSIQASKLSMPAHILKEDLCLSESDSDAD